MPKLNRIQKNPFIEINPQAPVDGEDAEGKILTPAARTLNPKKRPKTPREIVEQGGHGGKYYGSGKTIFDPEGRGPIEAILHWIKKRKAAKEIRKKELEAQIELDRRVSAAAIERKKRPTPIIKPKDKSTSKNAVNLPKPKIQLKSVDKAARKKSIIKKPKAATVRLPGDKKKRLKTRYKVIWAGLKESVNLDEGLIADYLKHRMKIKQEKLKHKNKMEYLNAQSKKQSSKPQKTSLDSISDPELKYKLGYHVNQFRKYEFVNTKKAKWHKEELNKLGFDIKKGKKPNPPKRTTLPSTKTYNWGLGEETVDESLSKFIDKKLGFQKARVNKLLAKRDIEYGKKAFAASNEKIKTNKELAAHLKALEKEGLDPDTSSIVKDMKNKLSSARNREIRMKVTSDNAHVEHLGKEPIKSRFSKKLKEEDGNSFSMGESYYLIRKSNITGIPVSILREIYIRGTNEWYDLEEKPNHTASQHAFNRINSFISGGEARELDKDLLDELSKNTLIRYIKKASRKSATAGDLLGDWEYTRGTRDSMHLDSKEAYRRSKKHYDTLIKRTSGIEKAADKLAKK